ncbi:MAG: SAM-dependent methyltransferase [Ruminococcaceae bacterium]|nr:SAM-dependent methyltransferase [Oscillospiraceae bacterium]
MNFLQDKSKISLSKRLKFTAAAVRDGSRAADVGCDHGYLSAHLILSGKCPLIYATDISEKSLKKAKRLFVEKGIEEKVVACLADGLDGISPDSVDDVVIAGLGGDSIFGIVSRHSWLKDSDKHLVLVPSSRHAKLRRYLYKEGFAILSETAVWDKRRAYTVMSAKYEGNEKITTTIFEEFGKILSSDGDNKEYITVVKRRYDRVLREIGKADKIDVNIVKRAREILTYIENLEV